MKACSKTIIENIKVKGKNDPCPPRGKGTFKVANVCEKYPYVYYSPRGSIKEFKEAIEDLSLPFAFPKMIQKYYMLPKCKLDSVPKKVSSNTVVVDKLTTVGDAIENVGGAKVIKSYIKFISSYLSDISKINPQDIWQMVSTDFKVDNIMVDVSKNRFYITDFTPARAREDGTFDIIMTSLFVLSDDFTDYDERKKYNQHDISKITYDICLLCMLTTLYFMVQTASMVDSGYSVDISEDAAADETDDLYRGNNKTLRTRQEYVLAKLSKIKYKDIDLSVVKEWFSQDPFAVKYVREPKKVMSRKSEDSPCKTFMKAYKGSSPKVVSPVTGRMVNKFDKNGNPTPLIKNLLKQCEGSKSVFRQKSKKVMSRKSSDTPCKTFMKAYKGSSPTVVNPNTGRKINKKDKNGEPTALIKKLIKQCE
jgi:hypothetical protein